MAFQGELNLNFPSMPANQVHPKILVESTPRRGQRSLIYLFISIAYVSYFSHIIYIMEREFCLQLPKSNALGGSNPSGSPNPGANLLLVDLAQVGQWDILPEQDTLW